MATGIAAHCCYVFHSDLPLFSSDNWASHIDPSLLRTWPSIIHQSMDILGQIGVTWFVLISSFFLSVSEKSPAARVLKVWVETFVFSVCAFLIAFLFSIAKNGSVSRLFDPNTIFASFFPVISNQYWFVTAYIVTILFSPFLNILLKNCNRRQIFSLCLLLVVIIFLYRIVNPKSNYWVDYGYLCTVYLIGGIIRLHSLPTISFASVACIAVFSYFLFLVGTFIIRLDNWYTRMMQFPPNLFGAGGGASPILSVVIGTSSFLFIIQRLSPLGNAKCVGFISKIILWISPATLGIYLVHTNFLLAPILFAGIRSIAEPSGLLRKMSLIMYGSCFEFFISLFISFIIHYLIVLPLLSVISKRFH